MDNSINNNDSQLQQGSDFQILDFMVTCFRHWKWFVLSAFVCVAIAAVYLSTKSPVYSRTASLLIKEQGKGSSLFSSEMNDFAQMGLFSSTTNVNNELVALQSPDLLLEVVRRLDMDMNYSTPIPRRLRNQTLYGSTLPVKVEFKDLSYNQSSSFRLRLNADSTFTLSSFTLGKDKFKGVEPIEARAGEEVMTPVGKVVVNHTAFYRPENQEDQEILVSRSGLLGAVRSCKSRLQAALNSKQSTIIDITFRDLNTQRAEDFLNTLISAYNENWVKDKNQIAVSTSQFIDERLRVIERELGDVDRDISSYKSTNLIPDIQGASQIALQQATNASLQINGLNNQLYMARYVKDQVGVQGAQFQLLPANSGITGGGIDQMINEFNTKLLQRNSLVANSSPENPMVLDLDRELMIRTITSLLRGAQPEMPQEEYRKAMQDLQKILEKKGQEVQARAGAENRVRGDAFRKENAAKPGVRTTASGLQYEILSEGKGRKPSASDVVRVHYEGTLTTGEIFDSSRKRGTPAEFPLNRVIAGWTEGLQLMSEGARFRFVIPPELAYGAHGAPPAIGPDATLVFDVELLEVK